ncbi:hypothetical protein RHGRI_004290 [Rhododendron griersonianum]|uniref:Uncharacterized protein n=1 Tax=Rhododendron griersonianum TaxID=479676 RepID=A0AAV6L8X0_9ERIC|nr:hypothetical protein RHGRI_004290 [Rhododendron griersonianum]
MAKEKQKGTVADKGKKKLTTTGKGKENSCPVVQVLRERNTGVVIRDEQDIMRLLEVILQALSFYIKSLVLILLFIATRYPTIMYHRKLYWPNVHDEIGKEMKD